MEIYTYNENCREAGEVMAGLTNEDAANFGDVSLFFAGSADQIIAVAREQYAMGKADNASHGTHLTREARSVLSYMGASIEEPEDLPADDGPEILIDWSHEDDGPVNTIRWRIANDFEADADNWEDVLAAVHIAVSEERSNRLSEAWQAACEAGKGPDALAISTAGEWCCSVIGYTPMRPQLA